MMMSKRPYLPLILLFSLLLFACRSDGNGPIAPGEPVTIILAVPVSTSERYRTLVEAFMAENEGVTVHVESMN